MYIHINDPNILEKIVPNEDLKTLIYNEMN